MSEARILNCPDEEDPFLSLSVLRLSLRQLLVIVLSGVVWVFCLKTTVTIAPISNILSGLIWSWIVLFGVVLAFRQKDGRPYEEYLAQRVIFIISKWR
jgi:hypothetical protein